MLAIMNEFLYLSVRGRENLVHRLRGIYTLFLEELVNIVYVLFVGLLQRVCGTQLIYDQ